MSHSKESRVPNTGRVTKQLLVFAQRSGITYSFPSPQKPLSVASKLQILLSENPESNILPSESRGAIIQRAGVCVCYDKEVEKDKTSSRRSARPLAETAAVKWADTPSLR